jgi:hypothetical protein
LGFRASYSSSVKRDLSKGCRIDLGDVIVDVWNFDSSTKSAPFLILGFTALRIEIDFYFLY